MNPPFKVMLQMIVIPISDIIDNIYQLMAHPPACQRSLSFTKLATVDSHQPESHEIGHEAPVRLRE